MPSCSVLKIVSKKPFLVVEALEISLQITLTDAVDPVEELVQKRVFHCE